MHIHILGICGTFMGGVAILARQLGYTVSGCDQHVYPPMSTQLASHGIELISGYDVDALPQDVDLFVIGNAMSRGNPLVEHILNRQLPFVSGPAFIHDHVLNDKWVLAVAGTHGKTTTSSMLAHILDYAGMQPGFLIGGVPENFGTSARMGGSDFFVIEADEYDTAFFDKRSKFLHYSPKTVVLNNLEFDHADIFDSLEDIKKQFHHFVRIVPSSGLIIFPQNDQNLQSVLEKGCWSDTESFCLNDDQASSWSAVSASDDASRFQVYFSGEQQGVVDWGLIGKHNMSNAVAAIAAARHAGVPATVSIEALAGFVNVKRRMQLLGAPQDISIYDDFAHHPTAIQTTLEGLRNKVGDARIFVVFEPRSNTMRSGHHVKQLAAAFADADDVYFYAPTDLEWSFDKVLPDMQSTAMVFQDTDAIIRTIVSHARPGDHVIIMSNGGFENIHQRLIEVLQK